jgi:hypothetical protein
MPQVLNGMSSFPARPYWGSTRHPAAYTFRAGRRVPRESRLRRVIPPMSRRRQVGTTCKPARYTFLFDSKGRFIANLMIPFCEHIDAGNLDQVEPGSAYVRSPYLTFLPWDRKPSARWSSWIRALFRLSISIRFSQSKLDANHSPTCAERLSPPSC